MVIEPTHGVIGGAIINKDHFIALKRSLNILRLKSLKALAQTGQSIVGRDNDADKHLQPQRRRSEIRLRSAKSIGGSTVIGSARHTIASTFATTVITQLALLELTGVGPVAFLLFFLEISAFRHGRRLIRNCLVTLAQHLRVVGQRPKGGRPPSAATDRPHPKYGGRGSPSARRSPARGPGNAAD